MYLHIYSFLTTPHWRWKIGTKFPVFKPIVVLCFHVCRNARFYLSCHFSSLKNTFPVDTYQNFCVVFCGHETLTLQGNDIWPFKEMTRHLTLQGNDQSDMLPVLCEILTHPQCNLQYLRYTPFSLRTPCMCTEMPQDCRATLYKLGKNPLFWFKAVLLQACASQQKVGWSLVSTCTDHWTT